MIAAFLAFDRIDNRHASLETEVKRIEALLTVPVIEGIIFARIAGRRFKIKTYSLNMSHRSMMGYDTLMPPAN